MSATTKTRLEECLNELRMAEKEKPLEGFRRGELKELFEYIAEKYNLSFNSVRNIYYKEVRNNIKNFETVPIQQAHNTPKVVTTSCIVGQIVKVKITNVVEYGAFVETIDGKKLEGLIHISEIKNDYVENIHHYFKIGDIVEAKIKRVTPSQKIEFSTKDIMNILPKQIQPQQPNDNSLTDITNFLNGMVGVLSPKAKAKLIEMIRKYGVVKFTIAMMQSGKTFENDLGLILLEQIQRRIEDCL